MSTRTFVVLFILAVVTQAESQNKGLSLLKVNSPATSRRSFDGNSIVSMVANDGPFIDYRLTNSSGLFWPKGSSSSAVYSAGLWIAGKHQPTGTIRSSVQYYLTEFQAGPINGTFNTSTNAPSAAADQNDTTYRVYKINKGDNSVSNKDYAEWPGHLGAPYNDVNTNGVWDAGTDTPKLHGTQTLFHIYNDLDTAAHAFIGKSHPLGVEVKALVFGFDAPGPLGNTMFMKWRITNKSDAQYDSLFIGIYSDTDMGDANDDVVGFDSDNSMSYVYNGDNNDMGGSGYGAFPPACGFMFISGNPSVGLYAHPLVLKHGTAFNEFGFGDTLFSVKAFNMMKGLDPSTGNALIDPVSGQPSRFALSGDPVGNTGWLSSTHGLNPQDVRQFLSVGPVTMAPNGTQEITMAFVIAQGIDRLNSITLLRDYADSIRSTFALNPDYATSIEHDVYRSSPVQFALEQNYPNPFNPSTTIRYSIADQSNVSLAVHNMLGQRIALLEDGVKQSGTYSVRWNGTDDKGIPVASGLYFYHITAGNHSSTKKMMLLK